MGRHWSGLGAVVQVEHVGRDEWDVVGGCKHGRIYSIEEGSSSRHEKRVPVINKGAKPHAADRRCQGRLLQTVRCARCDEEGRREAGATVLVKIASAVGMV
jgi:hypothetical protein